MLASTACDRRPHCARRGRTTPWSPPRARSRPGRGGASGWWPRPRPRSGWRSPVHPRRSSSPAATCASTCSAMTSAARRARSRARRGSGASTRRRTAAQGRRRRRAPGVRWTPPMPPTAATCCGASPSRPPTSSGCRVWRRSTTTASGSSSWTRTRTRRRAMSRSSGSRPGATPPTWSTYWTCGPTATVGTSASPAPTGAGRWSRAARCSARPSSPPDATPPAGAPCRPTWCSCAPRTGPGRSPSPSRS